MANELNFFDNKIIILYILEHSTKPLNLDQIVKFCEEFDDITYFDVCSYIDSLKSNGYIEEILDEQTITYTPTPFGLTTLKELLEFVPGVNLHNLKKFINKNLKSVKTDSDVGTIIIPISEDEMKVSCYIKDGNSELVNITVYATSKEQAKNISKNWSNDSDKIYNTLLNMITKE